MIRNYSHFIDVKKYRALCHSVQGGQIARVYIGTACCLPGVNTPTHDVNMDTTEARVNSFIVHSMKILYLQESCLPDDLDASSEDEA